MYLLLFYLQWLFSGMQCSFHALDHRLPYILCLSV